MIRIATAIEHKGAPIRDHAVRRRAGFSCARPVASSVSDPSIAQTPPQAGRRRDVRRHVRHRSRAGRRAEPDGVLHEAGADGAYDGTIFHRVVKYGMVQGGDPLTKDPSKRALYGTGGLNAVKAEARAPKMTRGSVAAVLVPGRPDSAGAQFFIVLVDQPALDGQYTVFGHVADGIEVLQKISETPVDDKGLATDARRDPARSRFATTPAGAVLTETAQELGDLSRRARHERGPDHDRVLPRQGAEHRPPVPAARAAGVYNGMAFHRVAPGFVIQTGALASRAAPLTEKQQKLVHNLQPEFNDTKHVKGIVSMARGDAPDSATTSFFICTGTSTALDGQYTAFGRVVDGMAAVEAIEAAPRTGKRRRRGSS